MNQKIMKKIALSSRKITNSEKRIRNENAELTKKKRRRNKY